MQRKISQKKLLELASSGASIEFEKEEAKPLEINGLEALTTQFTKIIREQELQRKQLSESIASLVRAVSSKSSVDDDLKAILRQLVINTQPCEPVEYDFLIQRTHDRLINKVETVVKKTVLN